MKKETYKDVVKELERLNAIKEDYDALIACGIPQSKAFLNDRINYELSTISKRKK